MGCGKGTKVCASVGVDIAVDGLAGRQVQPSSLDAVAGGTEYHRQRTIVRVALQHETLGQGRLGARRQQGEGQQGLAQSVLDEVRPTVHDRELARSGCAGNAARWRRRSFRVDGPNSAAYHRIMSSDHVHQQFIETAQDFAPDLARALQRLGPQEFRRRDDLPFPEYLCRAISGQQISVKAAQSIWARVVASAEGRSLVEHFAACDGHGLRQCGLSNAKVKTIQGIARTHLEEGLDVATLRPLSARERADRLTTLWGVGAWTADMMNMFYFGEQDVWPDGDVAARKTLERLTSKRRKTVRTAQRFQPYRSWLAIYMWAHVDAPPDGAPITGPGG